MWVINPQQTKQQSPVNGYRKSWAEYFLKITLSEKIFNKYLLWNNLFWCYITPSHYYFSIATTLTLLTSGSNSVLDQNKRATTTKLLLNSLKLRSIPFLPFSIDPSHFSLGLLHQLPTQCPCFWSCLSIQFSHSVMSDSLQPHGQPPAPQASQSIMKSRVHPNSSPLSQWCHPVISSSVVPFSSCPQAFPASGSFQMNQLFPLGGQNIGVSASVSVLPMNTQDWSPLGWTGRISLQSKGLSKVFSNSTLQNHQFFGAQLSSQSNSHVHTWLLEKP